MLKFRALVAIVALSAVPSSVWAQPPSPAAPAGQVAPSPQAPAAPATQTVCGQPVPAPSRLPPAGSGPVVYLIVPCFQKQGGYSVIEAQTYLYYLQSTQYVSS